MLTLGAVCDLQNAGFRARSAEYRVAAPAEYRPGRSLGTCAPKRVGSSPKGQLSYGRYGACSGSPLRATGGHVGVRSCGQAWYFVDLAWPVRDTSPAAMRVRNTARMSVAGWSR